MSFVCSGVVSGTFETLGFKLDHMLMFVDHVNDIDKRAVSTRALYVISDDLCLVTSQTIA